MNERLNDRVNAGAVSNMGKIVMTVFCHEEQAGMEKENVWHCRATGTDVLQTYYGAGTEADFLECWLEVVEPDVAPAKKLEVEQELDAL